MVCNCIEDIEKQFKSDNPDENLSINTLCVLPKRVNVVAIKYLKTVKGKKVYREVPANYCPFCGIRYFD